MIIKVIKAFFEVVIGGYVLIHFLMKISDMFHVREEELEIDVYFEDEGKDECMMCGRAGTFEVDMEGRIFCSEECGRDFYGMMDDK